MEVKTQRSSSPSPQLRSHAVWLAIALFAGPLCVAGCTNTGGRSGGYSTIGDDPMRDTERAKRLTQQALTAIDENEADDAEQLLKRALEADIMYGPAHINLGKLYYDTGRLYEAAWEFEYAAKLMPNTAIPRNNLGLVFESVGKLDEAVDAYSAAMDAEPANTQIVGNLARARIRRGDRGPEIKELLRLVIMKDDRPEWVAWANDQLNVRGD